MARPSTAEKLAQVHMEAVEEFDCIQTAVQEERKQCLQDRRFYSIPGAQWEGLEKQFENRPKFEINKIRRSIIRIINEYRNNRIAVAFTPKDGTPNDDLADACASLMRADEQDSHARNAYDNGFEESVGGGMGAWRLRAKFADEDDEDELDEDYEDAADRPQRISIEPINDADSCVFFDLNSKLQDKSDAEACFVIVPLTRPEYERKYGEESPRPSEKKGDGSSWDKSVSQTHFDWFGSDTIYVAEYYKVERVPDECVYFTSADGETEEKRYLSDLDEEGSVHSEEMDALGFKETYRKKIRRKKVRKYILDGNRVLKDCGYICGPNIPIVVNYGMRWVVDNVERCAGEVRTTKDAQRIKNMQLSKLGEIASLSSISKPIFTPEQIKGLEIPWSEDNRKNYAFQLVNPVLDAAGQTSINGPVGWTKPPEVPPALAALVQIADVDIKELLGNPEQGEKMLSHVAGKTVELLQEKIEGNAYIYISNMAESMRRTGQIWLGMAPKLYTQKGRKMKGVNKRDQIEQIRLLEPRIGDDGRTIAANDLSRAKFDVVATVGPSSTSKRRATVNTCMQMAMATQDQETQAVLSDVALANLEGEGVEGVRDWSRKRLVRKGVVPPTDEESKQMQAEAANTPPDPNTVYLRAEAEKATATAEKARAEIALMSVQMEKMRADIIATLADVDLSRKQAAVDAAKSLHDMTVERASLVQAPAAVETPRSE